MEYQSRETSTERRLCTCGAKNRYRPKSYFSKIPGMIGEQQMELQHDNRLFVKQRLLAAQARDSGK